MKKNHTVKNQIGFSMVETLVAIAILVVAVGGPITLAWQGLQVSVLSREHIIAFNLAIEGVEHIRFVRDGNFLDNVNGGTAYWLDGLNNPVTEGCLTPNGCRTNIDIGSDTIAINNCLNPCEPLKVETLINNIIYNYEPTAPTSVFTRTIRIDETRAPGLEADVVSTVEWETRSGSTRSVVVEETMFNWPP